MDCTPNIIRESSSGLFLCSIRDEMLRRRELECVGQINAETVYSLCRQLRHLQYEDPDGEITLFINSPGGEVSSGLALYDVMKAVTCPIRTVCMGTAASMGAVLFAAGDRRDILTHGRVMIHDPLIPQGVGGSALELETISKNLLETRRVICTVLSACTGRSLEEIYACTARDTWFTAKAAVDFGLADRIITAI